MTTALQGRRAINYTIKDVKRDAVGGIKMATNYPCAQYNHS